MDDQAKKIRWYNLALMAFVSVWGFGNVVNNFANQGLTVIVSWVLIIGLYFVPYALMVGELGSTFKDSSGGVSSWIRETMGPTLAYFAGWTYWVVHIPYLAQKPQAILIALGWTTQQNGDLISNMAPMMAQLLTLGVFLFFLWVASRGVTSLKKIGTIAGTSIFVMSMLYILLMVTAPAIKGAAIQISGNPDALNAMNIVKPDFSLKSIMPEFNFAYFTTLSMLVFAVGGAEKISPYVNKMNKPSKEFPKGMIVLAAMVAVSALLGSIAMGMMFDSNNIPPDLMMNGQYYAFQKLGEYYGVGNIFLVIYAAANVLAQISALVFSIDAPLKILIGDADKKFIPDALAKVNKHGAPVNGYIMTAVLVGILIIVPALGIGDMNSLFDWMLKLNSVVMPLRYLWVFLAFIMLKKYSDKFHSDYKFLKNDKIALGVGMWCFAFTAFACVMGMFPKVTETVPLHSSGWWFQMIINVATPFVLFGLGLILPKIAKKNKKA